MWRNNGPTQQTIVAKKEKPVNKNLNFILNESMVICTKQSEFIRRRKLMRTRVLRRVTMSWIKIYTEQQVDWFLTIALRAITIIDPVVSGNYPSFEWLLYQQRATRILHPMTMTGPFGIAQSVFIRPYTGMNLSSSPPWILIVSSKKKKKVRLATNHFGITSNKIFYIYKTNKIKICKQDFLKTYKTRRSIIELRKHKADAAAGVSITVSRGTEAAVFELEVLGIQFGAKKDYVNLFTWRHSVPLRKYVSRKKLLV